MNPLSHREKCDWLRLARTQNVGPVTFTTLIARFGSAAAALTAIPKLAERGGARNFQICSNEDAEREIQELAQLGGTLIASCEPRFPRGLAALDPPPPIISVLGQQSLLTKQMVAVVGARIKTGLGRKFAAMLAADLANAGLVIASGMARGIDAAAHEASLKTGTCAVLAGGIDMIYPPENAGLYERIRQQGLIVSEMPLHESPQARHFPRRNRIISGMSRGVAIVEAAEGSGSLITANYALEQGREVFAVPGSPLDPRARGTNRLIRQGATLIESADDILQVLKPMLEHSFREPEPALPKQQFLAAHMDLPDESLRRAVVELLAPSPIEIDELIRRCKAPAGVVMAVILDLELAGEVLRHAGNRVSFR